MNNKCEAMDFCVRLANKNIAIHSVNSYIHDLCEKYLVDAHVNPDFEICTNKCMIEKEIDRVYKIEGIKHGSKIIESLLIHRLIAETLLDYDTLLMHGAVVATSSGAYMFTGVSGTGKTTHVTKWLENIEGSFIVNGDKPFLISRDSIFACGTPWSGKEHYDRNTIVPLNSIVLMQRSNENRMEEVSFKSVFPLILQQTHQPADADKMRKTLALLMKLKDHVYFYRFYFDNFKDDCFQVAYDALTKQ